MTVRSITDVAEGHLCSGCGACAFVAPGAIRMVDDLERGRRPVVDPARAEEPAAREALAACPGAELAHDFDPHDPALIHELVADWGPIRALWEGYAVDDQIRFAGSSGGAATALALFAMQSQGFSGTLHINARQDVPYLNETVFSTTRAELLAATGSRYAPASPCDGLERIAAQRAPAVFIGKPCDVAGASKAAKLRPALAEKLGLTIAIFCAGTPSTAGTLEMLRVMGLDDPARLSSVRYRGNGWPGKAVARARGDGGSEQERQLSYDASWGWILQRYRQWRCYVCADHTGEFADVSVGDPWYRPIPRGEPGRSLVLARTERGVRFVEQARRAGYLELERAEPWLLPASQMNLLEARGSVWARTLVCRALGAEAPRYRRLPIHRAWWRHLSLRQKAQSVVGTVKRVFRKRLRERSPVRPLADPEAHVR